MGTVRVIWNLLRAIFDKRPTEAGFGQQWLDHGRVVLALPKGRKLVAQGLGDTVHNLMERLWIGPKVRARFARLKRNCGCEARRQWLNQRWPYAPQRGQAFLTIGMPHFQDWEGAWGTIQSVLWEAVAAGISDRIEILVVDQSPDSEAGKKLKGYLQGWVPRSKYVAQENLGTAAGKSAVFANASGEWVLLLDCHAALKAGSLKKMFDWMVAHRFDGNLYGGVMEFGAGYQHHRQLIADVTQQMAVGPKMSRDEWQAVYPELSPHTIDGALAHVAAGHPPIAFIGTDHGYHTHVDRVWQGDSLGRWATDQRGRDDDAAPFAVDNLAGWFLFCRRDAWLRVNPYHPLMRGFGGEEGVMTLAFEKAGRKSFVAPFARGSHRFGRADGVKFSLTIEDRIRNYTLAFHSWKRPDELERMRDYFVTQRPDPTQPKTMTAFAEEAFDAIVAKAIIDHENFVAEQRDKAKPPPPATLEQLYEKAKNEPSDFNEHVEVLRKLASECSHVTEFGTRHGVSTVALVAAQPDVVVTVDLACAGCHIGFLKAVEGETDLRLVQADSLSVDIEPTDLLFVDTLHTADQLFAELTKHAPQARKYIALHDTEAPWGYFDEHIPPGKENGGGIRAGLARWQATEEGGKWAVLEDRKNNHGFLVMSRVRS